MLQKHPITAIVLTRNEEVMIADCLKTLSWCRQIVVLDQNSTDQTKKIAEKIGAEVVESTEQSFAKRRTQVLAKVRTPWVIYVDADERVTPGLAQSVVEFMQTNRSSAGLISRKNFFFGQELNHGGWLEPAIPRVFTLTALQGWHGEIHESPTFTGSSQQLTGELWHFSHRTVKDGLLKSIDWTPKEAELLFHSPISRVSILTILRKGLGEFWRRGIARQGFRDGETGWVEAIIQAINRMLVYLQVWEMQQKPPISSSYMQLEQEIRDLWTNT